MQSDERQVPYLVFTLVLSVYAIVALAVTTFVDLPAETRTLLEYSDTAVCALFFVDFVVTFAKAPNRLK